MSNAIASDKAVAAFVRGHNATSEDADIYEAIRNGLTAAAPELPNVQEANALAAFIRASTRWGVAVALVSCHEMTLEQAQPVLDQLEEFIRGVVADPAEAEIVIALSEIRELKTRSHYPGDAAVGESPKPSET